ncbi:adenosine kinase [Kiloniella laminariae]|uniref:adenosine kinase n=1 Tax=Kiloniella laminariae TaxID=454162 RepID=UPI0003695B66|nr:adenosine kinase [Kiloniella laminariae]
MSVNVNQSETASLDVVGIGNAIVDIVAPAEDSLLQEQGIIKGAMTLIDQDHADALYDVMGPAIERSGGSAGNTMAGIASLGGRGGYIGKVRDDQFGQVFRHDIRAAGVKYDILPATEGPSTARCLIFVTPDAERSMNTYLGACVNLTVADIDEKMIASAQVTYMEGYLWDPEEAKKAFILAAEIAHAAGRKVALTLSDSFCVARHRESFLDLVKNHVDILFANEEETMALFEVDNFDTALQQVRACCSVAALTRSEKGSVICCGDEVHVIDAEPVDHVVDTTGAGDLYAAGFLFGYTNGYSLYDSGRIGSIAAAEVISHFGARPEKSLATLIGEKFK